MIPPLLQWVDEVKHTEKKEKKEAKLKEQKGKEVRRSPRTIDIRKFYKESSSSGEEKAKVLFCLNPFAADLCFDSLYFINTGLHNISSKVSG